MQTSRSTTCTQHVDDVLDPDDRDAPARAPRGSSSTSSPASASVRPRADLVEQQHAGSGRERPRQLEPLAVEQAEALGAAVGEVEQAAQLEHLDAAVVGGAARAGRRPWRRPTKTFSNTVMPPNGRGHLVRAADAAAGSACAAPPRVTSSPRKRTVPR